MLQCLFMDQALSDLPKTPGEFKAGNETQIIQIVWQVRSCIELLFSLVKSGLFSATAWTLPAVLVCGREISVCS